MRKAILCGMFALLCATAATARTWSVRKDGTGDFPVIQSALDVSAAGDTILIGPGAYTEYYGVRYPTYGREVRTFAHLAVDNLTLIGSGANATLIGPTAPFSDMYYEPDGIAYNGSGSLKLVDLCVRNCYTGVAAAYGKLLIERCAFDGNVVGLSWSEPAAGGLVQDSVFVGRRLREDLSVFVYYGANSVRFTGCEFVGGRLYFQGHNDWLVSDCRFSGRDAGVQLDVSHGGTIERCVIENENNIAVIMGYGGDQCTIRDSQLAALWSAISMDYGNSITITGSSLVGGSSAIIYADRANAVTVHGCDLHKGAGPAIDCKRAASLGAITYDMTNNYWGTTSASEIASWISDSADNAAIGVTVSFVPFAGGALPSESITWGRLKALFR